MKDNCSFLCLDLSGVATSETFFQRKGERIFQRDFFFPWYCYYCLFVVDKILDKRSCSLLVFGISACLLWTEPKTVLGGFDACEITVWV